MQADEAAQDVIAQNLANVNTVGYKRDMTQYESFPQALLRNTADPTGASLGELGSGVGLNGVATNFAQGALQQTDNPLDVALTGSGFLAVQSPQGVLYSRDGGLTRSASGVLIQAASGDPVLSASGQTITLPASAKNIAISASGIVSADNLRVGQLQIDQPATPDGAVKIGSNLFQIASPVASGTDTTVQQGYLESSNVNTVQEMVAMIAVQRAYETDQKMVQAEDNATNKAVTDVAKLA